MLSRNIRIAVGAGMVVIMVAGIVQAGFVPGSIDVGFPGPDSPHGKPDWAGNGPPPFLFEILPPQALAHGQLGLTEDYMGMDPLSHIISGETDEDPIMAISKDVENDSGFTWSQYLLTLPDGGGIKFVGTPTSDKMNLVSMSDYLVMFEDSVEDGEFVNFSFSVLIPSTGPFAFTLTQQPVPEPATVALLAIGGIALWMFRRRR